MSIAYLDYIVDEESFRLETLSSHSHYLAQLPLKSEKELEGNADGKGGKV